MSTRRPPAGFAALVVRPAAELTDADRLQCARSTDYWRELAPDLPIADKPRAAGLQWTQPDAAGLVDDLAEEGYFATGSLLEDGVRRDIVSAVNAVQHEGWPPVLAFVYDALWEAIGVGVVPSLMAGILGDGYRQSAMLWLNYVHPVDGASGWGPHIDVPGSPRARGRGGPERLTVWVAVTEATVDNSCIHVVPRGWAERCDLDLTATSEISVNDAMRLLHGARALPAPAGAVLGWAPNILHWGSPVTRRATQPRISLSLEFLHEENKPRPRESVIERGAWLDFSARLSIIGLALTLYGADAKREPYAHRFLSLGEALA